MGILMNRQRMIAAQPHRATASGSLIHLDKAEFADAQRCEVSFALVQSGSGDPSPSNVRPISGWTGINVTRCGRNLWSSDWELGGINGSTGANSVNSDRVRTTGYVGVVPGVTYALHRNLYANGKYNQIRAYDRDHNFVGAGSVAYSGGESENNPMMSGANAVVTNKDTQYWRFTDMATTNPAALEYMMVYGDTVDEHYVPYNGVTVPVNWQSTAGTVYGGSVDLVSGTLTVTHRLYETTWGSMTFGRDLGSVTMKTADLPQVAAQTGEQSNPSSLCNVCGLWEYAYTRDYAHMYVSSANVLYLAIANGTADSTPIQFAYELATPQTYQLTPATLKLLRGENNIFSDSNGTMTLTYWTH